MARETEIGRAFGDADFGICEICDKYEGYCVCDEDAICGCVKGEVCVACK